MARFPLFFLTAFFLIAAMIGYALLPLKPKPLGVVEARVDQGTFILDGALLSNIAPAPGFPVTNPPGSRHDQKSPRLASISALAPNAQYSKGARLALGPKTIAALSGKAVSVTIVARGLAKTPAEKMGFGLIKSSAIGWSQMAVSPEFAPHRFDIPVTNQPISGLAFWPAVEGQGHGIEIQSIALQPF
jgi:hypothetical protein